MDSSSSGSSSSGDSDEKEENKLKELLTLAQEKVDASPYQYDLHVELIRLFRSAGDLDGARKARNKMAETFPLSEELWLEWLGDELPLASMTPEACQELIDLFERATKDYLSVDIWLLYAQLAMERFSTTPDGMEFPRTVFEKAIIAGGIHCSKGSLIWNSYREFEMTILRSLQEIQEDDPSDDVMRQQVEEQFERVEKLFRRQLAVPLIDMEATFQEYKNFTQTVVTEDTFPAYARSVKRLQDLRPFEEKLASATPPTLGDYRAYLAFLQRSKEDGTLINTLYQRAVSHHPLDTELWKEYLDFLDAQFACVAPLLLHGHEQAIRNCPWIVDHWLTYARAQEKLKQSHEEIVATYDKAVGDNFSDGREYLQVWVAYCDYLRRRVDPTNPGEGDVNDLRRLFRRARNHLDAYYERDADPQDTLSRYQASLEARCYGNMEEARILWDDVMSRHGREAQFWLEYAQLERDFGDLEKCRKLLQRAVNSASDDPNITCNTLLQFEREQGSLETFEAALVRCTSHLQRVKERKEKVAEKEAQKQEERKKQRKERKKASNQARQQSQSQSTRLGGQPGQSETIVSPAKKRKRMEAVHTFFEDEDEDKEREDYDKETNPRVKKRREVTEAIPLAKPIVMAPPSTVPAHLETVQEEPEVMETSGTPEGKYDPVKWLAEEDDQKEAARSGKDSDGTNYQQTVFVSNITFSTTQQQLKDVFSGCGEVADVRLIRTRGGRDGKRGNIYAYVEFTSPDPVSQALLLDRSTLNNRPMFVSVCKQQKGRQSDSKPQQSKFADTNQKATVFVSNIPHDVGEEQLKDIFKEAGELKEVRLVYNRQGRSKGFAYIEYLSEPSAQAAVMKLDGHYIFGKHLKVAISKPPKKPAVEIAPSSAAASSTESSQPLGQKVVKSRQPFLPSSLTIARKSRTNISMLPRAIARPQKPEGSPPPAAAESGQKMSNEDFRQLLMKPPQ